MIEVSNSVSTSKFTQFDILGKPLVSQQITEGQTYTSSYQYNLSGALISETYPSGRVVKNDYDTNGEISKIYGQKNAAATERTYANAISYTASGVIEKLKLGNGRWESAKLNSRQQVTELAIGSSVGDGSLWKLNYNYGELQTDNTVDASKNSGNIARQTINFNGLANPIIQNYKYDSLDRITEAKETANSQTSWQQNFGYDRYGNRTNFSQVVNGNQLPINNFTKPNIDADTNRITTGQGYVYDGNGNLIQDANGRQFTFNGDNKQTQVKDVNNQIIGKYSYDGSGKRIKKETNLETTIFVYSGSKLIAEYSTQLAANPTTSYTVTDMLGSPRVITDANGQVISRRDFMAFGEEVANNVGGRTSANKYGQLDSVRQRFTGYQKDDETGLDFAEARYYNDAHGRFTAVDPLLASGKSVNPQTFNRYVYSMNRPLILTDPTGMQTATKPKAEEAKPKLTPATPAKADTVVIKETLDAKYYNGGTVMLPDGNPATKVVMDANGNEKTVPISGFGPAGVITTQIEVNGKVVNANESGFTLEESIKAGKITPSDAAQSVEVKENQPVDAFEDGNFYDVQGALSPTASDAAALGKFSIEKIQTLTLKDSGGKVIATRVNSMVQTEKALTLTEIIPPPPPPPPPPPKKP